MYKFISFEVLAVSLAMASPAPRRSLHTDAVQDVISPFAAGGLG
jgi:hypothetical protein